MDIKRTFRVILFFVIVISGYLSADENRFKGFKASGFIEMGMDSLERGYYRPQFRFDFDLDFVSLFIDIDYHQRMERKLKGEIDYWVMVGLEKELNVRNKLELRVNHMCRHKISVENVSIYDLNEVVAKFWLVNKKYKIGIGGGGFAGGSADFDVLFIVNLDFPFIFGSPFSLSGEFKYVDFEQIFHEAELLYSFSESTGFFVRNTRYYGLKNITYFGLRTTTKDTSNSIIDSIKFVPGVYPGFYKHKAVAYNQFRFVFAEQNRGRLTGSIEFNAPMWKRGPFFGRFLPENMDYLFFLEYERRIGKSLFLVLFGKYRMDMRLDRDIDYEADAGTGVTLRNQHDFDMVKKNLRFEASCGYNFTHKFEFGAKLGITFLKSGQFRLGSNLRFMQNSYRFQGDIKLFIDYERGVNLRPFIGFEKVKYDDMKFPEEEKFVFGIGLYKWFQ